MRAAAAAAAKDQPATRKGRPACAGSASRKERGPLARQKSFPEVNVRCLVAARRLFAQWRARIPAARSRRQTSLRSLANCHARAGNCHRGSIVFGTATRAAACLEMELCWWPKTGSHRPSRERLAQLDWLAAHCKRWRRRRPSKTNHSRADRLIDLINFVTQSWCAAAKLDLGRDRLGWA